KWVFGGVGQGALNAVNLSDWYTSGGNDMGLNMSTAGYYTFVLRDVGYANSNFYVGYTAATPVSLSHNTSSQVTLNGDYTTTIQATLSTTPSAQESFYVRYRVGTNDFSTGTSITTAGTVSGTTVTLTIPTQSVGSTIYYYIFSTTVPYATLNGYSEQNKSLSALAVADNSNSNYSFTIPAATTYTWAGGATGAWTTSSNWSPVGVPGNGDAVIFNNGTSVTVTAVPSVNLRSITMTSTGAVVWQGSGSRTINVGFTGATNPVFSLAANKQFSLSGTANDITINIESGYSATISGTIVFSGTASVSHQLKAESASAITFQNGSLFQAQTNFSGHPFGASGVNGSVIFQSGAIFEQYSGSNPFGTGATDNIVVFQTGSWYKYKNTSTGATPVSSGRTFANYEYDNGISRTITGTSAIVMDNLVITSGTLNFNMTGTPGHSIKGDITIASGATLNFAPSSAGTVNFNGSSEQYITVNGIGLITTGANSTLTVSANSTLNFVGESYVGGSGTFVLQSNSAIGIGSASGITTAGTNAGNVRTATRTFISDATYIYNGAYNQVTGTGLPLTINNNLRIANTGAAGNNTVTLTTDNTTVFRLYLNSGYFAAGSATRNLNIAANGFVYGNGGNHPDDPSAGNIVFLGAGQTNGTATGNPYLYSVIINGGVDFNGNPNTNSATIMNKLQLNSSSFVSDAPYYQSGSTLVYNTGGPFSRNVEWGSASNQGYPHHVTVQGGTTLNLNTNPITPATLALAGDLRIGNSNGTGTVILNNNMIKALEVNGDLYIGSADAASNGSALTLSTSSGGDLRLYGNFSRYNNSFFTDNSRATYFLGSANTSINTPNETITPGVPTQYFSYFRMSKSVTTADVTLNCPVGITNEITLTSGTITSTNTNLLVMNAGSTVVGMNYGTRVSGGSDNSFVNGPMRKIGNTAFVFPVGKPLMSSPDVGGHRIIAISAPANVTDAFTAEFYLGNANLMGDIVPSASPYVVRVSACEYWRLERSTGTSNVNVTLSWGTRSNCNVNYINSLPMLVVVHNNANSSSGVAPFSGNWDSFGNDGGTTGTTTAGTVTWNNISTFSPFALGTINQNVNPLPFNLNRFNATPAKKNVQLDWAVGNNHEQQSYTLERSKDGIHFEAITHVAALKDVTVAEYNYADEQPLTGWNYYRLRATDKQLKQATSRIIRIWWGQGPAVISVLPNPASEKIVINLSDPSSITEIQIVNSTGQVVKQTRSVQFSNEVNVSSLQAGMYYIRLFGKNGLTTKSFVKQ
ncbi:MAG: T9SS type A sorting domain-containing protein, partial [Chitinophagaceae bacterium]|nr:T9SS type A sorting domain-containing protein [Chitinophagaceae bacterium]